MKKYRLDIAHGVIEDVGYGHWPATTSQPMYLASEVDAALAELKADRDRYERMFAMERSVADGLTIQLSQARTELAACKADAELGAAIRKCARIRLVGNASNYVCVELWKEHPELIHYPDFFKWLGVTP